MYYSIDINSVNKVLQIKHGQTFTVLHIETETQIFIININQYNGVKC